MIEGKNAIVTGVSKGIGLEIVKQLIGQGVNVAGWGRTKPSFSHDNFHFIQTDVSRWEQVQVAFSKTSGLLGENIHFLINNAGYGVFGPVEEMDNDTWEGMFNTNVHGLFYCSKIVIPGMKKMDQGHIVNISSIAGKNPVKMGVAYAATKHAVTGISHSMYMELRDFGIKVSCVYPGSVSTHFFDNIDSIKVSENMMRAEDVAQSVVQILDTHPNYLPVDIEVRPLRPNGKPTQK
ncbi:MAG: SDR family NAD(P)-dependent oxidoreductase [Cyclobacteriaceae bacterium]|nr:SDR family NAD(P)-dependent oxidoreductase [Cyclobacteriaceae bacterium HetDA_MAG_MS6]